MEFTIHSKKYGDKIVIIDDEDYDKIKDYKWNIKKDGYIQTCIKKESGLLSTIGIHRIIMNTPKGMVVDHINHNKLDNRKENLRVCTDGENLKNSLKPTDGTTSKYKGVCWLKNLNKYKASISVNYNNIYLGIYKNEIDAAIAYNKAAIKYHGEFALLNNID